MRQMQDQGVRNIYCVDSSSLITVQRIYPLQVFPGVWEKLNELVQQGRFIAPHEVLNELDRGADDDILRWAKEHESMFHELDSQQSALVTEIISDARYQGLFDVESETPDADPFVIALAVASKRTASLLAQEYVVVSDEVSARPGRRPKIPDVCRDARYDLKCIRVLEVFKAENWQFEA